jgi:hypothetical protein
MRPTREWGSRGGPAGGLGRAARRARGRRSGTIGGRTISALLALAFVALAIPAAAYAVVATLSNPPDPNATASCPGTATTPCTVVSRTTAMQVKVGDTVTPFKVTTAGRIVGWEITLSSPTAAQIKYFDANEGGTSQAAVAVIRQVKALDYRLEAQAPVIHLEPYFGRTVDFPLASSIAVKPGDVIALTVPTWVPALELQAGRKTAWRASRGKTQCTSVGVDTAQRELGSVLQYYCIYRTALIDFAAIEISTP